MTTAIVFIPLTQGKVAVIDFADFEKVRGFKWQALKSRQTFYAARCLPRKAGNRPRIFMHRMLTDCPANKKTNHENGDGLDNRRVNLQVCTTQQNAFAFRHKMKNTSSSYRGVYWNKQNRRWLAQIKYNDKKMHIGYFDSEEDAARAYDAKAVELFGEFAAPNFKPI